MNFLTPLHQVARGRPRADALIDGEVTLSYAELWSLFRRTADRMAAWGLEPGDRVLVWASNGAPFVAAHFGAL